MTRVVTLLLVDADDHQLDQAVVDEDAMADLHFARQRRERRRDVVRVAEERLGGDDERAGRSRGACTPSTSPMRSFGPWMSPTIGT